MMTTFHPMLAPVQCSYFKPDTDTESELHHQAHSWHQLRSGPNVLWQSVVIREVKLALSTSTKIEIMSYGRRKYEPQVSIITFIFIIIIITMIHRYHWALGIVEAMSCSGTLSWASSGMSPSQWWMKDNLMEEILFRVNRYQTQFTLDKKVDKYKYELSKMDFIEEFLLRNMDHCAEYVISYLDFEVDLY